jgi:hypothetical protein
MTSFETINHIPHKELGLVQKSPRWMSKLLSQDQKKEKVRSTKAFIKLIQNQGKVILGNIIIMDELVVSFHTTMSKNKQKQRHKKGTPGRVKAQVHARRSKQVFIAFVNNKGMVYTYHILRGKMVNADNITKALHTIQKVLKLKMLELRAGELFSQRANAPSHPGMAVKDVWAQKPIQMFDHQSYSPHLVPVDFFLFPKTKNKLVGISIT